MPMAIGPRLIYAHMPKTGGTFVSAILSDAGLASTDDLHRWGQPSCDSPHHGHMPLRFIRHIARSGQLVCGTLRNPWAWYVSAWYQWQRHGTAKRSILETFCGPDGGFSEWLRFACLEPSARGSDAVPLPFPPYTAPTGLQWLREHSAGLYSYWHHWLYESSKGACLVDQWWRIEHIAEDLGNTLAAMGANPNLAASTPLRVSSRWSHDLTQWYTPELAEMVADREWRIMERGGYTWEEEGRPNDSSGSD